MKDLVIVRGGGDIATGTIYKLFKCGFKVLILEIEKPSAIRRNVAFCEAIYDTQKQVEDVTCYLAHDYNEAKQFLMENKGIVLIQRLKPLIISSQRLLLMPFLLKRI